MFYIYNTCNLKIFQGEYFGCTHIELDFRPAGGVNGLRSKHLFTIVSTSRVYDRLLQDVGKCIWRPSDLQQDGRTDGGSTEDLRSCA